MGEQPVHFWGQIATSVPIGMPWPSRKGSGSTFYPLAEGQAALEMSRQRTLATGDRVVPGLGEPSEAGRSS